MQRPCEAHAHTFSRALLVCFPHSPANIPPTCALKLLISSFSIIIQVRSPYELRVGSAGCTYTESAWRISESRGWSLAGSAQQTLWSSSHMSAETQKNGWGTIRVAHRCMLYARERIHNSPHSWWMKSSVHDCAPTHSTQSLLEATEPPLVWSLRPPKLRGYQPSTMKTDTQQRRLCARTLQIKGHKPNLSSHGSDSFDWVYAQNIWLLLLLLCLPCNIPLKKVLFGAADVGLCSLQIVMMTGWMMCPFLPRRASHFRGGRSSGQMKSQLRRLVLMLFAVATAAGWRVRTDSSYSYSSRHLNLSRPRWPPLEMCLIKVDELDPPLLIENKEMGHEGGLFSRSIYIYIYKNK